MLNPEDEQGHQNLPLTIREFLSSSYDLQSDLNYAQNRPEIIWNNRPTDEVFAKRLIEVGTTHIKAILKGYPNGTLPLPSNMRQEDKGDVRQSLTAIVFGASYIALRSFVSNTAPNEHDEYSFYHSTLFTLFDNALTGTLADHKMAFNQHNTYPTRFEQHLTQPQWDDISSVVRHLGVAALFQHYNWKFLPEAVHKLIHGLYLDSEVQTFAKDFKHHLGAIGSTDKLTQAPDQQTSQQAKRDAGLRRLLGINTTPPTPISYNEETSAISDPTASWNDKDWFNKLFGE